jgi:hypothetical protein
VSFSLKPFNKKKKYLQCEFIFAFMSKDPISDNFHHYGIFHEEGNNYLFLILNFTIMRCKAFYFLPSSLLFASKINLLASHFFFLPYYLCFNQKRTIIILYKNLKLLHYYNDDS